MSDINKNDWRDFLAHYGVKGMKWGKRKGRHELEGVRGTKPDRTGWNNSNIIGDERLWNLRRHLRNKNELRKTGNYNGQKAVYQFKGKARPTSNATAKRLDASNRGNPAYSNTHNRGRERMASLSRILKKKKVRDFPKKVISKAKTFLSGLFSRKKRITVRTYNLPATEKFITEDFIPEDFISETFIGEGGTTKKKKKRH